MSITHSVAPNVFLCRIIKAAWWPTPEDCACALPAAVTAIGTPVTQAIPHMLCKNLVLIDASMHPPFSSSPPLIGGSPAGSCEVGSEGRLEPLSSTSSNVPFEYRDSRPSFDVEEDMNDQSRDHHSTLFVRRRAGELD